MVISRNVLRQIRHEHLSGKLTYTFKLIGHLPGYNCGKTGIAASVIDSANECIGTD